MDVRTKIGDGASDWDIKDFFSDLKGLSAVIALLQDRVGFGVQQACFGINDTNMKECEHSCFCLPSTIELLCCMRSVFFLLNPPTGSEYARTGQLRWGGFLYFVSFCWVPCLLEMWKALEHKRTNKRLDSTQRCCKLAFMYLPHLKSDWLFYRARALKGLSLSYRNSSVHAID